MKSKYFWKGFLSAFDPFKTPPMRKASMKKSDQDVLEAEFRKIPEAELLMHNAFARAITDVK